MPSIPHSPVRSSPVTTFEGGALPVSAEQQLLPVRPWTLALLTDPRKELEARAPSNGGALLGASADKAGAMRRGHYRQRSGEAPRCIHAAAAPAGFSKASSIASSMQSLESTTVD